MVFGVITLWFWLRLNLGFTYEVLDKYIRTGLIDDKQLKKKIDQMHEKNLFKLQMMPSFSFKHESDKS